MRRIVPSEAALAAVTASDRAAEATLVGLVAAVAVAVRRLATIEGRDPEAVLGDVWRAFVAGEV